MVTHDGSFDGDTLALDMIGYLGLCYIEKELAGGVLEAVLGSSNSTLLRR